MTFPHTSGFKGKSETGRLHVEAFAPKLGRRQAEAVEGLSALGVASAEALAELIARHWYLTGPGLSELSAMGLVTDSDQRGRGTLGGAVQRPRLTTTEERAAFLAAKHQGNGNDA